MRWTGSDTAGFLLAAAITTGPPLAVVHFLQGLRKPGDPPPAFGDYVPTLVLGLAGAGVASAIAWRWGGSPPGRWLVHGAVAAVMLVTYAAGCCFWVR